LETGLLIIVYISILCFSGLQVYREGSKTEIAFYAVVYCGSFVIMLLFTLDIFLPSLPGYITKLAEQVYEQMGLSSFIA
jgi:hypothetical protein